MTLPFDAFIIDSLIICPLAGALVVAVAAKLKMRRFIRPGSFLAWLFIVYIAAGIYYDKTSMADLPLVGEWCAQFGSGNSFMWNFEAMALFGKRLVADIPTYEPWWNWLNLLAWAIFLVIYPLCVWFGVGVGKILFGRSDRQLGVVGLLPWFNKPTDD